MDLSKKKTIKTLGVVGVVLIIIIGFILVIQPFMAQASKYSADFARVTGDKNTATQKLSTLQQQKSTIEQVENHDDELSKRFPGLADTPSLVNSISKAATDAGMNPSSIKTITTAVPSIESSTSTDGTAAPAPTAEGGEEVAAAPAPDSASTSSLASISVDITAEGSINELTKLTKTLANVDRNLTVNTVSISKEGEGNKASASIQATTYIYKSIPKVGEEVEETTQEVTPTPETSNAKEN